MKWKHAFLSVEECARIHAMSLRVLEEVGMEIEEEDACAVFRKHGARVEGRRVYIRQAMLEEALNTVPASFSVYGRKGKETRIGGGCRTIAPAGGPMFVRRGGEQRRALAEDFKNFQKLCHSSRIIDMNAPWITEPADIDRAFVRDYQMAVALKYTDKPVAGYTTSRQDAVHSIEMTQKFYDNHTQYVSLGVISAISPLKYDAAMLQAAQAFAERNQPLVFASCAMPGATSPVTLSGTIAVNNAEILAGIVLSQLIRPGLPVVYGNTTGGCDLRYAAPTIGSLEAAQLILATAAMAAYYRIPCRTGGSLTDSKCVDWQAGAESAMTLLTTLMTDAGFVFQSCGILDSFNTLCYEKFILDEQNIELFRRMTEERSLVPTEEDFQEIAAAGPGGQYLDAGQTVRLFKKALYIPKLSSKMEYNTWEQQGCINALDRAAKAVEERLASYQMPEASPGQEAVLRAYIGDLINAI